MRRECQSWRLVALSLASCALGGAGDDGRRGRPARRANEEGSTARMQHPLKILVKRPRNGRCKAGKQQD